MSKSSWPKIKRRPYPNGTSAYTVDCRINGKGERLTFKLKSEAQTAAEQARIKRQNEGHGAFTLEASERVDAEAALRLLRLHGRSLREAAAFLIKHIKIVEGRVTVGQLVAEMLLAKTKDGASGPYLKDLRTRLNGFSETFADIQVADVTTAAVDDWLRALDVKPVSRNNCRRVVGVLFNYGLGRGYCLANPVKHTAKAKEVDRPPGILTVVQAKALLDHAETDAIPAFAIGLFAGLRPEAEARKLGWEHINFEGRLIDVGADRTKGVQQRYVVMTENLAAWLPPHRKESGLIWSLGGDAYYDRLSKARRAAGIVKWPSDAIRHTYASMHYAKHQDAGATSEQMGHSDLKMLFRHYRERVKPSDAERYWNIWPSKQA